MPTTKKTRKNAQRRTSRGRRSAARQKVSPVNERAPLPDEPAQVMTGNRVTHVVIGIDEYERLVKRSMELDAVAQIEREKVGDDSAEWIDHRDFAAQLAGDAIAKARKGQGMTQKQLADKLDMPQSQISRIERNPDRTTIRTIKKIAKALGVDVRALISTMGR